MRLVSVIIPVYNAEAYIKRCLESVCRQTYHELQILIIDDGSQDSGYDILKEYASSDGRIELIHQENKGVSAARNKGLELCRGYYVFFVDADDSIDPEYIEHYANMPDAPFIGGGYVDSTGWKNQYADSTMTVDEYRHSYVEGLRKVPSVHVTGNRYKQEIISENQLKFDEQVNCGEDSRFNAEYFKCINEIRVTSNCEYRYTVREDSLVNRFIPERLKIEREECKVRETLFYPAFEFGAVKYIHWHIALEHYYSYLKTSSFMAEAKQGLKKTIRDEYFRQCLPYLIKKGSLDMKIEGICLKAFLFRPYKSILKIILRIRG